MNTFSKFFILSILIISSCEFKEDYELPSWDVGVSAPIASGSLGFDELLSDSTISIDTTSDNGLIFVYQQELVNYSFEDLIEFDPINFDNSASLGNVEIPNISFSQGVSFGEIISVDPFNLSDGAFVDVNFPPFNQQIPGIIQNNVLEYDASEDFHMIYFEDGTLQFELTNGFAVDLENISIKLRTLTDEGSIVNLSSFTIPILNSNATYTNAIDLSDKTMYGNIEIQILNADLATPSASFSVNYSDKLLASVEIKDILMRQAQISMPYQELINDDTTFTFDVGDALLNRILMTDGDIVMTIESDLNTPMQLEYRIPSATLNGQDFYVAREIPAGGSINETISLAGYEFDLTGKEGNDFNTIYVESFAKIDSSDELVTISVSDGISSAISIEGIALSAAWGFIGKDTITESSESSFVDLSSLNGDLDFEFIEVRMVTENYIGASANLNIQRIESFNESSSLILESASLATPFVIEPALESQNQNQPVIPSTSEIVFNESNSNIDEIVESRPNALAFDFEMIVNGDNDSQDDGFIYLDYGVKSELQVEIPVSFQATNIFIQDTIDVSLSVPDLIENGSFSIIVDNGFPFSAEFKMQLLNEDGVLLTELSSESIVQASELDVNGVTIQSTRSELNFPFEDLSNMLNNTAYIGIEATLNTEPLGQFVKLYSDYKIDFTVIANFETLLSEETFE
ncbi:hypothetical protein N9H50_00055 [bacterium]|nr:hypothetical protein [bacterium]